MEIQSPQKKTVRLKRSEPVADAMVEKTGAGKKVTVDEAPPAQKSFPATGFSRTLPVVFALIATILVAVLTVLQWREYSYYKSSFPQARSPLPSPVSSE